MARVHLRLTDTEFYRLTPRLLQILLERNREALRREEVLFGQIAAQIENHSPFRGEREAASITEFMPSEWEKRKKVIRIRERRVQRQAVDDVRHFFDVKIEQQRQRQAKNG